MIVVIQLPKLLRPRFYPSYAAMTFPFVITATALSKFLAALAASGYTVPPALHVLLAMETLLATSMVLYVFLRYLHFLFAETPIASVVEQRASG